MIHGIRKFNQSSARKLVEKHALLLRAGEAMPSLRTLMRESSLGRGILEKALNELRDSGILESRNRQGYFRTGQYDYSENGKIVDLVACSEINYAGTFFFSELIQALRHTGKDRSLEFRLHQVKYEQPLETYAELIEREKIRNAILFMPQHDEIPRIFRRYGVHYAMFSPRYLPQQGMTLFVDLQVVEKQLQILFGLGHRKIGFISEQEPEIISVTSLLRRESYYRTMAEHGFRVRPNWVIPYDYNFHKLREALNLSLANPEHTPTALIVPDSAVAFLYQYLQERGQKAGRGGISLIAFDGIGFQELRPSVSTFVRENGQIAESLLDLLEEARKYPDRSRSVYAENTYLKGESTAPRPRFKRNKTKSTTQ